jgi:hypothetical protein
MMPDGSAKANFRFPPFSATQPSRREPRFMPRSGHAVICPTCSEYAARPLLTQAVAIGDCHG